MLLVVHTTNLSRRPHLRRARACAPRLALLQDGPTWEREYADRIADVDTRDLDACVRAARELHEQEPVEAVVAFVEHSVLAAATIAEDLGVRGPGVRTATLARDKYLMRRAMDAAGVPCPRFALAGSVADAQAVARDFGYPVILKPIIGGGSQYVRRVDNPAEVAEFFPGIQAGVWDAYDYDPMCAPSRAAYHEAVPLILPIYPLWSPVHARFTGSGRSTRSSPLPSPGCSPPAWRPVPWVPVPTRPAPSPAP